MDVSAGESGGTKADRLSAVQESAAQSASPPHNAESAEGKLEDTTVATDGEVEGAECDRLSALQESADEVSSSQNAAAYPRIEEVP